MNKKFTTMKVLIFGNTYIKGRESNFAVLNMIADIDGIEISVERGLYDAISNGVEMCSKIGVFGIGEIDGDIALSIGGDGTFLNTSIRIGSMKIPILGVNMGRLGFLTDVNLEDLAIVMERLKRGDYVIEERSVIETIGRRGEEEVRGCALNDIAVMKQELSSMIAISAHIDGEFLHTYEADGLVIATPTGSTAYSLSVGGPIMMPNSLNLIIAPVASHSLSVRPLVIPDSCVIELKIESRSGSFLLSADGRSFQMDDDWSIEIKLADYKTRIVRLDEHSFFDTLKRKLMWGVDARR